MDQTTVDGGREDHAAADVVAEIGGPVFPPAMVLAEYCECADVGLLQSGEDEEDVDPFGFAGQGLDYADQELAFPLLR